MPSFEIKNYRVSREESSSPYAYMVLTGDSWFKAKINFGKRSASPRSMHAADDRGFVEFSMDYNDLEQVERRLKSENGLNLRWGSGAGKPFELSR